MSNEKFVSPTPRMRAAILAERRNVKMARSAHAYMRGNTVKFYEWLGTSAGKSLPEGPPIWICGDCHVDNLGPVASLDGKVAIQIRDLDQTVIGNPVHDLIRLGLSLAMAARSSDLPGVTTARMIEEMMAGYSEAMNGGRRKKQSVNEVKAVQRVMEQALRRPSPWISPSPRRYAQEASWREDNRRVTNGEQVRTVAHVAMKLGPSADFSGYWQRHVKAA
jgi:uncharacterized protein (DUF2252 family)